MACIIYWQAKVINRVILEAEPEIAGVDLSLSTQSREHCFSSTFLHPFIPICIGNQL